MSKTTTTLLFLSVAGIIFGLAFVTGLINAENMVALYVALPLGAVFFGLFLISRMLEKEASLYDEEQHAHSALKAAALPVKKQDTACGCGCAAPASKSSPAAH